MAVAVVALVFVISFGGTGLILRFLKKRAILDHPNERSSHSEPTPKGAGIDAIARGIYAGLGESSRARAAGQRGPTQVPPAPPRAPVRVRPPNTVSGPSPHRQDTTVPVC